MTCKLNCTYNKGFSYMLAISKKFSPSSDLSCYSYVNHYNFQMPNKEAIRKDFFHKNNVQLHFFLAQLKDLQWKTLKACTFPFSLFKTTRLGKGWSSSPHSFLENKKISARNLLLCWNVFKWLMCKYTLRCSFIM